MGVLCIRAKNVGSSVNLTWRVLTHCTPFLVLQTMTQSTIQWHLWAVTFFPQPNVHDPSDIHAYYMFLLIHPRKVLLAGCWVTTQPLFSCGIILPSLPLEVGLHGMGLVHLSCAWKTPIHKGMPTSDMMRRSQFWWEMCDCLYWSITS